MCHVPANAEQQAPAVVTDPEVRRFLDNLPESASLEAGGGQIMVTLPKSPEHESLIHDFAANHPTWATPRTTWGTNRCGLLMSAH